MSILFIIWCIALLTLASTLVYAHVRVGRSGGVPVASVPNDFTEFLSAEWHEVLVFSRNLLHATRPHGERAVGYVVLVSRRGYDLFIERVFGRTEVTKGKTTSFFLKHISEHKEAERGEKDIHVQ